MKKELFLKVLMLTVMILLVTGCPSEKAEAEKEKEIELPDNYFRLNKSVYEIDHAAIVYIKTDRTVIFYPDADGNSGVKLYINFGEMGNPTVVSNQFPIGTWTVIDGINFVNTGYGSGVSYTFYNSASTYNSLNLTTGGVHGSLLTVNGTFAFTSGSADDIAVVYSGPYGYESE